MEETKDFLTFVNNKQEEDKLEELENQIDQLQEQANNLK